MSESDIYMARKKLKISHRSNKFSFVSTVWKGDIFMGTYNKIMGRLTNVYNPMYIVSDDIDELETIISSLIK